MGWFRKPVEAQVSPGFESPPLRHFFPVFCPELADGMPRTLLIACLVAACAAPADRRGGVESPDRLAAGTAAPVPQAATKHQPVTLRILGRLPQTGELRVVHESGLTLHLPLAASGEFELSLPIGPCAVAILAAGRVLAEHVFVVGEADDQTEVWRPWP